MSLKNDAIPSSAAFDQINDALKNEDDRKDAVKKAGAIFGFSIKNASGEEGNWYVDLKESGKVGKGAAPEGKKADVTLVLSDDSFAKLVSGKAKAQQMFMSGKLKIRGNMMLATKLEPVLKKAQGQIAAKL